MATKVERRALRLHQGAAEVRQDRVAAAKRRRNKRIINWTILAVIVIGIVAVAVSRLSPASGKYDGLATCITESGATMYGTDWCPHCQEQKQAFGASFKLVAYINCDQNPTACETHGIRGFPTWVLGNGTLVEGTQPLAELAAMTGCPFP